MQLSGLSTIRISWASTVHASNGEIVLVFVICSVAILTCWFLSEKSGLI